MMNLFAAFGARIEEELGLFEEKPRQDKVVLTGQYQAVLDVKRCY